MTKPVQLRPKAMASGKPGYSLLKIAIAGAAAVWVMDRFDWFAFQHEDQQARRATEAVRPAGLDPAHALAAKVYHAAGFELGAYPPHQHPAGLLIHYAVPIGLAALYAAARNRLPIIERGKGTLYGATVFIILDEIINPLLGFAAAPGRYPWQRHARELTTHLIYGAAVHILLRVLDAYPSPKYLLLRDR